MSFLLFYFVRWITDALSYPLYHLILWQRSYVNINCRTEWTEWDDNVGFDVRVMPRLIDEFTKLLHHKVCGVSGTCVEESSVRIKLLLYDYQLCNNHLRGASILSMKTEVPGSQRPSYLKHIGIHRGHAVLHQESGLWNEQCCCTGLPCDWVTGGAIDWTLRIRFHFIRLSPTNFGRNQIQTPPPTARQFTPHIKEENTAMTNCTRVSQ